MGEKKNIDRLFQEKFKDFEAVPGEHIWNNIEAELHGKKQKRRVVPLWIKLSGVAAILVIGSMFLMPYFSQEDSTKQPAPVVFENNGPGTNPGEGEVHDRNKITEPFQSETGGETVTNTTSNGVVSGSTVNQDASQSSQQKSTLPLGSKKQQPDAVVHQSPTGSNGSNTHNTTTGKHAKQRPANAAATTAEGLAHENARKVGGKSASQGVTTVTKGVDVIQNDAAVQIAEVQQENDTNSTFSTSQGIAGAEKTAKQGDENTASSDPEVIKGDMPAERPLAETEIDTTAAVKPENELEKILQDKLNGKEDKEQLADATGRARWQIKPQMAPLYYNSLSNGSPIDPSLSGNTKNYDSDLSYGVGVNYALNDRLSVRTGVNTVNLSYATEGVEFYASMNESMRNISPSPQEATIVVQDVNNNPSSMVSFSVDNVPGQKFDGSVVQQMGYVEVPVELSYAVLNKKFAVDVIGGMSTMFLNNNKVSAISSEGASTTIGQASNLNNVNFTGNVGLGFRYKFIPSLQASFEPMFKYQMNTFSRDSGNFRPYFIGLYTGLSFSF